MSQENVEIVKTAIDAFNCRDMRVLADLSHEDLEIVSVLTAANLGGATYRASEAWTSYFAAMDETWEEWQVEDFDVFDGSDDRVACLCRMVGKGKHSGVPVERAVGITYQFRQARLWRVRSYLDPGEALEAAGLRE
jgi:ketosteroid isomerase-like protein